MKREISGEEFSVEFCGPALDGHEIPAAMLAQSLLALDHLATRAAAAAYGKDTDVSVKVKGAPRAGSFIIDLLIQHSPEITTGAGAVTILMGVFGLAKWAFGKRVKKLESLPDGKAVIVNEAGDSSVANITVIHLYDQARTGAEIARFTQSLDRNGVDEIVLSAAGHGEAEKITKRERRYFRQDDSIVLTDNEATMALEIIGARLNGSPNGWVFSEGENTREFVARVEDEEFLNSVRENRLILKNGTTILATVRIVQKKAQRTIAERSILEVIKVIDPAFGEQAGE